MPRNAKRGHFVDVNTLASALFAKTFKLQSLCEFLDTDTKKLATEDHGKKLTPEYLRYAMTDVQVTWECYCALATHFEETFHLPRLSLNRIFSAASLGKAYLKAMKIKPWRVCQPDFPAQITGQILSSYSGGRSEVRIRREVRQVIYCDFLSMYPTVCTSMGLWRFITAQGITYRDATDETRSLLNQVKLADLQSPLFWGRLNVLVQVLPNDDLFPVRAAYGEGPQATIGLNRLTFDNSLWFTLADCLVSTLLNGRPPNVVSAIVFEPDEQQTGLASIDMPGGSRIDPKTEDFYRAIIDRRQELKRQFKAASPQDRDSLDIAQNSLKIIANATSYGALAEINVQDRTGSREALCYGPSGEAFPVRVDKDEEPGPYFHPLVATLITGAARLMLALTERLIIDAGLEWVLCDTDSMVIARPESMDEGDFYRAATGICEWFEPLNPYSQKGPVLKIEDANYSLSKAGEFERLYAFAVSAKRYALFNRSSDGKPLIRKASAHGLGHFRAPYADDQGPDFIPAPPVPLDEIGVRRWQYDLWHQIICAAYTDTPERVDLGFHRAMDMPAIARYSATTPALTDWFKDYNAGKPYERQVKPFNFLASLMASPLSSIELTTGTRRRQAPVRPIAPFDTEPKIVASRAFDRTTGEAVPLSALKTFRQALAQYHLHPEGKFEGGDYLDTGSTRRRHIHAIAVVHIGKEANRWEEQQVLGFDPDFLPNYGLAPAAETSLRELVLQAVELTSVVAVSRAMSITPRKLHTALEGGVQPEELLAFAAVAVRVVRETEASLTARCRKVERLRLMIECYGLTRVAGRLGLDKSNLRRSLTRAFSF